MTRSRLLLRLVLVALGALLLGWFVVATTVDRLFGYAAPEVALGLNPRSADANARLGSASLDAAGLSSTLNGGPGAAGVLAAARARALRSLDRQPVNPGAARLLALAVAPHDPARARWLLAYAEAMSRRDLQTELTLIEFSVQDGDVAGALTHYDRALRTSEAVRPVLFPVLAAAANQPAIWRPLAGVLARRPPWWRAFLETMIPQSTSPAALRAIALRLGLVRGPGSDFALVQAMEKRLVDLAAYPAAADLYDRAHGIAPGRRPAPTNGGFEAPGGWDPFDWNLLDEPDLAALREPRPGAAGTALFLDATNGRGGDVATQLVLLAPGAWRIDAVVGAAGGDRLAFPQLIVRCAGDGRELLHAAFPPAPDTGVRWAAALVVPPGCPAQRVVMEASSRTDPSGAAPWIDDVVVRPAAHPAGRG